MESVLLTGFGAQGACSEASARRPGEGDASGEVSGAAHAGGWTWIQGGDLGWTVSDEGDLIVPNPGIEESPGFVGKGMVVRDWPTKGLEGVRAVEVGIQGLGPENLRAGLVLYQASDDWLAIWGQRLVSNKDDDFKCKVVLERTIPGSGCEVLESDEVQLHKSNQLCLRLEISADGTEVAGLVDLGYCLKLLRKSSAKSTPSLVGVMADNASSTPVPIAFKSFRLLSVAADRHQFVGVQDNTPTDAAEEEELKIYFTQAMSSMQTGDVAVPQKDGASDQLAGWTFSQDLAPEELNKIKEMLGGGENAIVYNTPIVPSKDTGSSNDWQLDSPALQRCKEEIEGLHVFFELWFSGKLPKTADAFARVQDAFHADFHMMTADG